MLRSLIAVAIGFSLYTGYAAPASAATLWARAFPLTGEVRIENRNSTPVSIVFLSIKSSAAGLNGSPVRWLSIHNHYDAPIAPAPGNGLIDPNGSWTPISADSDELTEGALDADGGRILARRAISLGKIWNPAIPFGNLEFSATELSGQPISFITLEGLDGDYDWNGVVNQLDYIEWRENFGSTTAIEADGNVNGIVDAADYVIWRNNLGLSLLGTASTSASGAALPALGLGSAVPEPASLAQAMSALAVLCACGRRLRRRVRTSGHRSHGAMLSGGSP